MIRINMVNGDVIRCANFHYIERDRIIVAKFADGATYDVDADLVWEILEYVPQPFGFTREDVR